ncbi:hybrid sensor histidine kinase/response regulator [Sorangium cellulosum]|uniref:histidine kinase n=1 Tax=Sorangium cellulosum TaxID=56 RepID=A0A150QD41_SORCE|nr:ATP-binding protein [Sorangium cellulosum]KYF65885.1 histidine kinase [Sorangium cellulosum]
MADPEEEELLLRSVALQNAQSILVARQRAEQELLRTKEALEARTAELARSLAMMRATLESTTDGILVVDRDGHVTDFNEKLLLLWQLPREALAPMQHQVVLDRIAQRFEDPGRFLERVQEIQRTAPRESYDLLELADGRAFERFSKLQTVDDRDVGRVWTLRDITERRRAEVALQDETRVLELLNRTGSAIASTLDVQTLLQSITDAATQLSGAEFGAFFYNMQGEAGDAFQLCILSGAPREAFEPLGHPRATDLFGPTFRGEAPIRSDDVLLDPRYGRMAPHNGMPAGHLPVRSYLAVPVTSRAGEAIGGLFFGHSQRAVFTERTERLILGVAAQASVAIDNARLYEHVKRAADERARLLDGERASRAELERVSLMKDEFLATLSHELRTPLNSILGWSELLLEGGQDAELRQGLETIARNARAQAKLIDDLLDMNRIISGKVRLDVQRTDLTAVVDAAVDSVRPSVEAKEIRLRKIIDPLAGPVAGDPNRLQQVVWNLLSNAVKFTPRGGTIDVLLERVSSHIEITVNDSGVGISPEFLPQMFQRFRQADSSTTRRFGGLGLGLSIVKQLVELHGGTIHAESPGAGQGSTFVVCLPLQVVREAPDREHPTSAKAAPAPRGEIALAGIKVLVVEDEADARELMRHVLARSKAEVITASSAIEGFELLRTERPDVVVSDIGMPQKDGYQFMREVRSLPPSEGGRVPAIALTAFARSEDRTKAMLAGYQVHLAKPIEPRELAATIRSLAGRTGDVLERRE